MAWAAPISSSPTRALGAAHDHNPVATACLQQDERRAGGGIGVGNYEPGVDAVVLKGRAESLAELVLPTRPMNVVAAPRRLAATAWLAPLPPLR